MTKTLVAARPPAAPPALPLDALDPAARARLTAAFARAGAAVREAKAALAADLIAVARELSDPAAAPPPDPPPAAGATPTHRAAVLQALTTAPATARAVAGAAGLGVLTVSATLGDLRRLGQVERATDRPPFVYRAVAAAAGGRRQPGARPDTWRTRELLTAGPATTVDIQARIGRPLVVIRRMLYDLRKDGAVRQEPDGRWALDTRPPAPDTLVWRTLDAVAKAGPTGLTAAAAAAAAAVVGSGVTAPLTALHARGLVAVVARRAVGTKNAIVYAATPLGREVLAGRAAWPPRAASRSLPDLLPAATLRALRVLAALTGTHPGAAVAGGEVIAADPVCRPGHLAVAVRDELVHRLHDGRYRLTPRGRAAVAAADRAEAAAAR